MSNDPNINSKEPSSPGIPSPISSDPDLQPLADLSTKNVPITPAIPKPVSSTYSAANYQMKNSIKPDKSYLVKTTLGLLLVTTLIIALFAFMFNKSIDKFVEEVNKANTTQTEATTTSISSSSCLQDSDLQEFGLYGSASVGDLYLDTIYFKKGTLEYLNWSPSNYLTFQRSNSKLKDKKWSIEIKDRVQYNPKTQSTESAIQLSSGRTAKITADFVSLSSISPDRIRIHEPNVGQVNFDVPESGVKITLVSDCN